MVNKPAKSKHGHTDKYSAEAAQHRAEVARDQERWAKERIDIPETPNKKRQGKRPTESTASAN